MRSGRDPSTERGYALVALMATVAIMLIMMSAAVNSSPENQERPER